MWVAKSGSIAILATGFFHYFANFLPELEHVFFTVPLPLGAHGAPLDIRYGQLLAMVLILLLGALNYFGVKVGGDVQVAVTILKVALILLIVIVGLGWGHPAAARRARCWPTLTVARVLCRAGQSRSGHTTAGTMSAWWLRKFASRSAICRSP